METITEDNEYIITLVVDDDYLIDKDRVWPVYVDPNITIDASGSGSSKTIQDVPIYDERPSTNHGSNIYNVLGYVGYWNGSNHGVGRTLMRFPGLINNSTYKTLLASQITNVKLHKYEASGQATSSSICAYYYTGNSNWTESGATYNNITWSGYGTYIDGKNISSYSASWIVFNITEAAKEWKSNSTSGNKGIMLKNTYETNSLCRKDFYSTESSSSKPYLSFDYTGSPTSIEIKNTPSNDTMVINNSRTLSVSAKPSDAGTSVTWSSTKMGVATVSSEGLINAVGIGTTTIRAISVLNPNVQNSFILKVTWPSATEPTIKTRADWEAQPPDPDNPLRETASRIIFHHTAEKFSKTDLASVKDEIRRVQNMHINSSNYHNDIGYHYIIDPASRIWEGTDIGNQGAHTYGYNDDIGIVILGDFEPRIQNFWDANTLNQQQKNAMQDISKWLCRTYNLPKSSVTGKESPINTHRTFGAANGSTVCPGANAAPWIEGNLRTYINNWGS